MKYPSVLLSIIFVWFVVDVVAIAIGRTELRYQLYLAAILFSIVVFVIGFWRNR